MAKRNHAKDMTEKTLETYGDVYADLMNVLIFGGQQVVSEGDLEQERDIAKYWNGIGCHIAFVGAENETDPEDDMPLRVIGYDGAAYRDQIKYVTDEKGKRKKLHEFLEGCHGSSRKLSVIIRSKSMRLPG